MTPNVTGNSGATSPAFAACAPKDTSANLESETTDPKSYAGCFRLEQSSTDGPKEKTIVFDLFGPPSPDVPSSERTSGRSYTDASRAATWAAAAASSWVLWTLTTGRQFPEAYKRRDQQPAKPAAIVSNAQPGQGKQNRPGMPAGLTPCRHLHGSGDLDPDYELVIPRYGWQAVPGHPL